MKLTVKLQKGLENVVGNSVKQDSKVVGKVTDYDKETGKATFEMNKGWVMPELVDDSYFTDF